MSLSPKYLTELEYWIPYLEIIDRAGILNPLPWNTWQSWNIESLTLKYLTELEYWIPYLEILDRAGILNPLPWNNWQSRNIESLTLKYFDSRELVYWITKFEMLDRHNYELAEYWITKLEILDSPDSEPQNWNLTLKFLTVLYLSLSVGVKDRRLYLKIPIVLTLNSRIEAPNSSKYYLIKIES